MSEARGRLLRRVTYLFCAAVLVLCAVFVKWGDLDPVRTIGLLGFLAFLESWRVQFPWGRPLRLGMAAVLCIIALRPVPEAVCIFFVGSLLGRVFYRVQEQGDGDFFHIVQRTYIVALSALLYRWLVFLGWEFSWNPYPSHYVLTPTPENVYLTYYNPTVLHRALGFPVAFGAMALLFYLGEVITSSLEVGMTREGRWRAVLPQHVRQTAPVYLAIVGAGALMALYFPRLPWLNFLIFFFPLMLVRAESNRDKELDERYFQTVRIIGDAFDQARGLPGHSGRVSNLAGEVAREMGASAGEVREIRYAAALHDIGRIESGGEDEDSGHAALGARVLEQVPRLRSLAHAIRHHHPHAEEGTARIPLGSKIISAVSDFDLFTNRPERRLSTREALEEMGLERGKKYDSVVLRVLSQVVEEQARARRRPEREIRQRAKVLEEEELKESLEEIFREEEDQGRGR